jgi:myo-inositol-1(or 4)-monophosphatase
MQALLNTAVEAARKAGDIISRQSRQLDRLTIQTKGTNEFATQVDEAAENAIVELLRQRYPGHAIIGEEGGESGAADAEHVWIIDPLDGTTNFIHGLPCYAVSIGLKIKGRLSVGVIYNPESQELFTAVRGNGATVDGRRMRVSKRRELAGSIIGTEFPFRSVDTSLERHLSIYKNVLQEAGCVRSEGSAAMDLCYMAAGRIDAAWMFGLKIWDIAAGVLILREAGGMVSAIDDKEDYMETGNLVAGTPKVHAELRELINKS